MAQPNWYRVCVGCGHARPKKELLRIVKRQDDQLEVDLDQRKPGRGAYICPTTACALSAKTKRGFNRSFHLEVNQHFFEHLIQQVKQIEQR